MKNAGQRLVPIRPMCGSWWGAIVTPTDWVLLVCMCIGFVGATTTYLRAYHPRPGRKKTQPAFISLPRLPAGPELDRCIAEDLMGHIPGDQGDGPYPKKVGSSGATPDRCSISAIDGAIPLHTPNHGAMPGKSWKSYDAENAGSSSPCTVDAAEHELPSSLMTSFLSRRTRSSMPFRWPLSTP